MSPSSRQTVATSITAGTSRGRPSATIKPAGHLRHRALRHHRAVVRVGGPGGDAHPLRTVAGSPLSAASRGAPPWWCRTYETAPKTLLHPIGATCKTWAILGVYPTMAFRRIPSPIVLWSGGTFIGCVCVTLSAAPPPSGSRPAGACSSRFAGVDVAPKQVRTAHAALGRVAPNEHAVYQALERLYIQPLPRASQAARTQNKHFEFYPRSPPTGASGLYHLARQGRRAPGVGTPVRSGAQPNRGHYMPALSPDGLRGVSPCRRRLDLCGTGKDRGYACRWCARGRGVIATAAPTRILAPPAASARQDKDSGFAQRHFTGHQGEHVVSAEATSFRVSPNERWITWQGYVWVSLCTGRQRRTQIRAAQISRDSGYNMGRSADKRLHWNLREQCSSAQAGLHRAQRGRKPKPAALSSALPFPNTTSRAAWRSWGTHRDRRR